MAIDYADRMRRLLARVQADVVVLVPGANLVYFTGLHFHLSERPILAFISADGLAFSIPELEQPKLNQRPDLNAQAFPWTDATGYADSFARVAAHLGLGSARVGLDAMMMRAFEWFDLAQAGGISADAAVNVGRDLLSVRAIKTPDEIDAIRRAVLLSEQALQRTLDAVEIGMTENQIAAHLSSELTAAGSEGHAFGPLVLTGPNSALPHGNTGNRALAADEFLLIDFGGTQDGYPADITRTRVIGQPTADMKAIYDAVEAANAAARAIAAPGVTCGAVDQAARAVIEAAGYGDYFIHRTGHGLGLETHELPNIAPGDETVLEPGMVFTIEPGIYVPGLGGVRIEDDMVVHADHVESLTQFSRSVLG